MINFLKIKRQREFFLDGSRTGKRFDVGYLNNYLVTYKSLDKVQVEKNKEQFIKDLKDEFQFTQDQAKRLADAILEKFGGDSMSQLKMHMDSTAKY